MNEQVEALAKPEPLPGLDLLCSYDQSMTAIILTSSFGNDSQDHTC